jgi:peptide/nickel transport system permease protein
MIKYIINRLILMVLTLCVLATLMFFMFRMLPGDPTMTVISSALNPRAQEEMNMSLTCGTLSISILATPSSTTGK